MNEKSVQDTYYHFVRFAAASEQEYYERVAKGEMWRKVWLKNRNGKVERQSKTDL